MEIKLAKSYGFCFGVKRAIKIAESTQGGVTLGPLIHNNKEIDRLKKSFDVDTAHDMSEIKKNDKVVIRTHGVPKQDLEKLKTTASDIIDATCPFVTKPQQICEEMSKEGYDIVIFGDENHPEVKGVKSYVSTKAAVVLNTDDLKKHRFSSKIAVVSQTTRKMSEFLKVVNYLIEHYKEVRVFNTICNATFENQDAAKELSTEADIMIVIGGKNSSNTKQLYSICKDHCEKSYLIESREELKKEWFEGKKLCGITAGASTPDWIIEDIINVIVGYDV